MDALDREVHRLNEHLREILIISGQVEPNQTLGAKQRFQDQKRQVEKLADQAGKKLIKTGSFYRLKAK
jgi:hypothetical protein